VSPVETEAGVQLANNIIDEGEFEQQREEEVVHHEELSVESNRSEWEEERSSSSLELRGISPRPPPVIPNSPNARTHLTTLNPVP
jgi:hypothetical protein